MELPEYIVVPEVKFLPTPGDLEHPVDMTVSKLVLEIPSNFKLYQECVPSYNAFKYTFTFQYQGLKHSISYMVSDEYQMDYPAGIIHEFIFDIEKYVANQYPDMHEKVVDIFHNQLVDKMVSAGKGVVDAKYNTGGFVGDSFNPNLFGNTPKIKVNSDDISTKSTRLPGVNIKVKYPCDCNKVDELLWHVVQHLNDQHEDWTRDRIADWVDELHDSGIINAEFAPWSDSTDESEDDIIEEPVEDKLISEEKKKELLSQMKPASSPIFMKQLDKEGNPTGKWVPLGYGNISMGPFSLQNPASAGTHDSGGVIDTHLNDMIVNNTKQEPVPDGEDILKNIHNFKKIFKEIDDAKDKE